MRVNWLVSGAGLALFGLFALLYRFDYPLYFELLAAYGANPAPIPYIDTQHVLAGIECARSGLDVYAADPCDVYGRAYAYSPFWLHAWFLPTGLAATNVFGTVLALAFLASLSFVAGPRDWRDALVLTAA